MRVGFASTEGACQHYRCELPARSLPLFGDFDVVPAHADLAFNTIAGSRLGIYTGPSDHDDYIEPEVIVLAGGYPIGLGAAVITEAREQGQAVICDCDDWPWLPTDNPHYAEGFAEAKLAALRAATLVTVSTPYLQRGLAQHGINSRVIRNTIDRERYAHEHAVNIARMAHDAGELVVGYRGLLCGFHDADLRELGPLPTQGVRYVHIGADPRGARFADLVDVPAELVDDRPAVAFKYYGSALAGVDVAIIPLARRPFTAAKSAIAAMEWHSAGVPWLASDHSEFALAGHGNGIVANPLAWFHRINELRDRGARAELYVGQNLPNEPCGALWADALALAARSA